MKILVLTATEFGNTATIASAITTALEQTGSVKSVSVNDFSQKDLENVDLFVVGSPTQKFYPLPALTAILKGLPQQKLRGMRVAAFDTRFTEEEIAKVKVLAFFVKIFGYAAPSIARTLIKKGGELIKAPEGFFVGGTRGPLLEGELERATQWGRDMGLSH